VERDVRPPNSRLWLEATAVGIVVALAVFLGLVAMTPSTSSAKSADGTAQVTAGGFPWPFAHGRVPAFALRDQAGQLVTPATFRRTPALLTFLDSKCKNLCPIEGAQLARVQQSLGRVAAPIVVVSVNPADTATSVRAFVRRSGWRGRWYWLMGSQSALRPVWHAFGIGVRLNAGRVVTAGDTTVRLGQGVEHTTALFVIGPGDRGRALYLPPFVPSQVAANVRAIATG
jgi:cytochrome oxidase Cu insertion factor (SCO1/SenC/PrrC family)